MAYILKEGGGYRNWYVGVTAEPKVRLPDGHGVDISPSGTWWIWSKAETAEIARAIEDYFINTLGTDGGPGGGDYLTRFVYAYRKTATTKP